MTDLICSSVLLRKGFLTEEDKREEGGVGAWKNP